MRRIYRLLVLLLCAGCCFLTAGGIKTEAPLAFGWQGDTVLDNGDTTETIFGRVSCVYRDDMGHEVEYTVQAVVISAAYGRNWSECSGEGSVRFLGDADTVFVGDCTGRIISGTRLRMTLDGYIQVTQYDETGTEVIGYLRYPVEDTHVETLSQSGGVWICGQ